MPVVYPPGKQFWLRSIETIEDAKTGAADYAHVAAAHMMDWRSGGNTTEDFRYVRVQWLGMHAHLDAIERFAASAAP